MEPTTAPNGGCVRASFGASHHPMIKVLPPAQPGEPGYLCRTAGTGNFRICRRQQTAHLAAQCPGEDVQQSQRREGGQTANSRIVVGGKAVREPGEVALFA